MTLARKGVWAFIWLVVLSLFMPVVGATGEIVLGLVMLGYAILIPSIFIDARRHGRSGSLWVIGVLVLAIVFVPVYLWATPAGEA